MFKVGWNVLDMVYNIDPITITCYQSFKEVGVNFYSKILLLDPSTFINNVIFNFGDIFDSIRDVILFFTDDDRGDYNIPYDAGYGLGTAIHLVLKPKGM